MVFVFNKETFGIFIKFGESFSLGSLLNQSQTYQGNPCGVYPLIFLHWKWHHPNLRSLYQTIRPVRFSSSGIRASALNTGSILSYFFFLFNLSRFVFCPCSVICFLVCVLLRSCLCLCFVLVLVTFLFLSLFLVSFRLCVKKKICLSSVLIKKKVAEI